MSTYLLYLFGIGLVYATATLGLHLLLNDCGEISLAQGGQVALAAFAGAHLFPLVPGPLGPMVLVGGATLAGALSGAIVAIPMVKLRGLAVAVTTLLLNAAIFHFVLRIPDFVGGSGGLRLRSAEWLPATDAEAVGWLTAITIAAATAIHLVRRGRFGLGLRTIRANEDLARSVGVPVERYRTAAYTLAGASAGVAAAMWVILHHGVAPSAFTDTFSLLLLTLVLLGGRGSVAGPVAAAISMAVLTGLLGGYGVVVSFLAPIALLLVLIGHPGGINEQFGLVARGLRALTRRFAGRAARVGADHGPAPKRVEIEPTEPAGRAVGDEVVLRCANVTRAFGGLLAVNDVTVQLRTGQVLALVGPNGAGKTTFLNVLSGHTRATSGTVWLAGLDITRTPAHRRAARGLRRTFQTGGHLPTETGLDHLRLGMHVRRAAPGPDNVDRIARELSLHRDDLHTPLADLPAGTARLIEIGTALAVPGRVLLLDEPTVGLTLEERRTLAATLRGLTDNGLGVILVDHDMSFVRRVADRVVTLDAGRIVAAGTPDDVFADPAFIAAYLGSAEVPA